MSVPIRPVHRGLEYLRLGKVKRHDQVLAEVEARIAWHRKRRFKATLMKVTVEETQIDPEDYKRIVSISEEIGYDVYQFSDLMQGAFYRFLSEDPDLHDFPRLNDILLLEFGLAWNGLINELVAYAESRSIALTP